ncbi:TPA: hypothetical protein ACPHTL_000258 [Enterobacter roggenkampii]|uniref:hypothetical protein n=1 Tax=Enterobacter roggenkampii TaxID=1812935 RepID=UPI003C6FCC22
MSNKYEDLIKNARMNADCGEHMSPEEVTTLLNVVETTFAALAAESAGLNQKMNKLATWPGIEFYSSAWAFSGVDGDTALEFMCDVQTPATDAFLAEVRAQGVDMFGQYHNFSEKLFIQKEAQKFAAQIRKGAQS